MKRKREIVALAKEYYKEYEILRDLSPEVFERAILDMFYTTSLSINEIEENL